MRAQSSTIVAAKSSSCTPVGSASDRILEIDVCRLRVCAPEEHPPLSAVAAEFRDAHCPCDGRPTGAQLARTRGNGMNMRH